MLKCLLQIKVRYDSNWKIVEIMDKMFGIYLVVKTSQLTRERIEP